MSQHLMNNYGQRTLTLVKGEGAYCWDDQGKAYLDALTGIAVCGLGHCHPAVTQAIQNQCATLLHASNLYLLPPQQALADELCERAEMDKVFFSNSGAEANEAAIKLARLWGHSQGKAAPAVIVMEGSFHGRTMATLSATGNPKVKEGFTPLVEGFVQVPYNDVAAVEAAIANTPNVCAILVEPVQGEGGIQIPAGDYLSSLRSLCDQHQLLLMLDEIQTGNGRTGHWFAWQQFGAAAKPDVLTTAKGLGNGVPIGACLASGPAADLFQPGSHGSTYGGNPMACAAALAVYQTIEREHLLARTQALSERLRSGFKRALANCPAVREIRICGLLIGIELDRPCAELVNLAREKALLINVTAGSVVRLLPPMILTDDQADEIVATVSELIITFCHK